MIATRIMERLGIPHVPYMVTWNKGCAVQRVRGFCHGKHRTDPGVAYPKTQKKDNSTSVYQHFVNCCEALGIKGAVPFLDRMIVLDYIIANEDRHLNNFGVIRKRRNIGVARLCPHL
ncbi:MAG: hypothetical protein ACLR23_14590 [Clostridia bacterium]